MRDVLIREICQAMRSDDKIVFLSADFGSPALDQLREEFPERFVNVGIAEQNLVCVAAGLALEGFTVYAYAIAPFISMRSYEQIRINLALMAQTRELNVNLIGVGAGLSYDVTGPTHHCLEDIALMRVLPNMMLLSPCDCTMMPAIADFTRAVRKPKYLRLDGKGLPQLYTGGEGVAVQQGFHTLRPGSGACLVSTGYMTHTAVRLAEELAAEGLEVAVVDVFLIKEPDRRLLLAELERYPLVISMEEGFIGGGGLDGMVAEILAGSDRAIAQKSVGFKDRYVFEVGNRQHLHACAGLSDEQLKEFIRTSMDGAKGNRCLQPAA